MASARDSCTFARDDCVRRTWKPLRQYGCASIAAALVILGLATAPAAHAACDAPANAIVAENCKPGTPQAIWDISGAGSPTIQGFATHISVAQNESVGFKISTDAKDYRIDIYRLGWYGGDGARRVDTVQPSAFPNQPPCQYEADTSRVDCGDWQPSAACQCPPARRPASTSPSWSVRTARRARATSRSSCATTTATRRCCSRRRTRPGRPTTRTAARACTPRRAPPGARARCPTTARSTRAGTRRARTGCSTPSTRWSAGLERNGYDVSYFTGVDSDRLGAEIREHRVFVSVGHDEYWSGGQRANVEAARDAGVNLAIFSGNEVFWKTRWEDDHRTLVTYKETQDNPGTDTQGNTRTDPSGAWTGTWRDPRPFNPEGGRPENALTGTIFTVNAGAAAITVPAADGKLRFWRGTDVANLATGAAATLVNDTIGYEWDEDVDNGARPAGLVRLSSTTVSGVQKLQDYGSTYASGIRSSCWRRRAWTMAGRPRSPTGSGRAAT